MRRPILLLSFALWGCGSQAPGGATSQANDSQAVRTSGGPVGRVPAIAIRLAARGGIPRLYRLPSLTEVPDALRGRLPPVERVVGVDPEAAFLYVRTAKHELLALDLESSRADTVATDVEQATLGPDGTLFAVDSKKRVVSLARRARLAWPQPLGGVPRDLFGAADQRIVAVVAQDPPRLVTAGADQPPASRNLEIGGDVAATRWGDLVAVAPDPLTHRGRVAGGAADLWAVTSWLPRGSARYTAQALPIAVSGDSVGPEGPLYVQVSVSQNQDWSQRLAQELGRAGLPAKVLAPATTDEGYRVVLGPYPTREVAEGIGRKLGRPYWIYQPQPKP